MVKITNTVVLARNLTDLLDPVEITGLGKGFKRAFRPQKPEQNQGIDTYESDIGQIANGLAEAITKATKFKHSAFPDPSSKTPFYNIVDDVLSRTRYIVFGSTAYVNRDEHLKAVILVQDDSCDYNKKILENFVKSLPNPIK